MMDEPARGGGGDPERAGAHRPRRDAPGHGGRPRGVGGRGLRGGLLGHRHACAAPPVIRQGNAGRCLAAGRKARVGAAGGDASGALSPRRPRKAARHRCGQRRRGLRRGAYRPTAGRAHLDGVPRSGGPRVPGRYSRPRR